MLVFSQWLWTSQPLHCILMLETLLKTLTGFTKMKPQEKSSLLLSSGYPIFSMWYLLGKVLRRGRRENIKEISKVAWVSSSPRPDHFSSFIPSFIQQIPAEQPGVAVTNNENLPIGEPQKSLARQEVSCCGNTQHVLQPHPGSHTCFATSSIVTPKADRSGECLWVNENKIRWLGLSSWKGRI